MKRFFVLPILVLIPYVLAEARAVPGQYLPFVKLIIRVILKLYGGADVCGKVKQRMGLKY
jgi:hypothetical protein